MQDECAHWLALRLHFLLLWGSNWANCLCIPPILGHLLSSVSLPPCMPDDNFLGLLHITSPCFRCLQCASLALQNIHTEFQTTKLQIATCMGIWLSLHVFYCSSYHTLKEKWGALVEGICLEAETASCTCDTRYSYMYRLWTMHDCVPAMYAVP